MRGWRTAAVAAVVVAAGTVTAPAPAAAPTDGLPALVLQAFEAMNQYRVDGVVRPAPPSYAAWLATQRPGIDEVHAEMGKLVYVSQRTRLESVDKVSGSGRSAYARVTIDSKLDFGGVEGAPEYTASLEPVRCWFEYRDGAWVLTRTQYVYPV